MKMTFRWYGEGHDPIPLQYIKQIPGVSGIMGTLSYKEAGENWEKDEIKELVDGVHNAGLECEVIESVNVHEDIKLGLDTRDEYIANYRTTIENLAEFGVKVIVYNFMPVFDWLRTDLAHVDEEDGSNSLFYDEDAIQGMTPQDIVNKTAEESGGLTLPGWEPERLARLDEVMKLYQGMTAEKLLENWKYFLEGVIPTCERVGIRMACHPDDPAWDLFGTRAFTRALRILIASSIFTIRRLTACACALARWARAFTTRWTRFCVTLAGAAGWWLRTCETSSTSRSAPSRKPRTFPAPAIFRWRKLLRRFTTSRRKPRTRVSPSRFTYVRTTAA